MNPTATIRVPSDTRDLLAQLATLSGQSLSSYLGLLAREQWRAAVLASEHQAAKLDEADPAARAEYELWEGTLEDGLD